jgi:single-stranded DNA-binding protein
MDTQKWQDKENITRYSTGIIVNEMKMLSSKTDSAGRNESPRENFDHPGSTGPDVPF